MADKQITIMIVEDEAITAMHLEMELKGRGYRVLPSVSNGPRAIGIAIEERPSVILMDINLPGEIDGIETARGILAHYNPRVIFTSGFDSDNLKDRVGDVNHAGYCVKPLQINDILKILESPKD